MLRNLYLWLASLCLFFSLEAQTSTSSTRTKVLVETNKGKFVLELFDETPLHRDRFIANIHSGLYNGCLFHRVISNFMIQGGDPKTRGLKEGVDLQEEEESTAENTIPAEIDTKLFVHVRGMLAAARQADEVNPERRSSDTQFYIVTGKFFTDFDLNEEEARLGIKYSTEQRQQYKLEGGTPHLDGTYTIFGRILEGYKVVNKIQGVATDDNDRPIKNVVIRRMSILPPSN